MPNFMQRAPGKPGPNGPCVMQPGYAIARRRATVRLATGCRFREAYGMPDAITLESGALAEFCRRWNVAELSLFGSSVRSDFGPASDVDVLVAFNPGAKWSLLDLVAMKDELRAMVGRDVDLFQEALDGRVFGAVGADDEGVVRIVDGDVETCRRRRPKSREATSIRTCPAANGRRC